MRRLPRILDSKEATRLLDVVGFEAADEYLVLYCARHDYGTRILMRTGNLAAVMKTIGHSDVNTAMHYQHPELEVVRAALDATG